MTYFDDFRAAFLADDQEGRDDAEKKVKALFRRCRRDSFVPPTLEEVQQYVAEKRFRMDPVDFWEFYESKGWMVGRVSMSKWKLAANRWERIDKEKRPNRPVNSESYAEKWLQKCFAKRQQSEAEEQQRRDTLDAIWKEAGVDR